MGTGFGYDVWALRFDDYSVFMRKISGFLTGSEMPLSGGSVPQRIATYKDGTRWITFVSGSDDENSNGCGILQILPDNTQKYYGTAGPTGGGAVGLVLDKNGIPYFRAGNYFCRIVNNTLEKLTGCGAYPSTQFTADTKNNIYFGNYNGNSAFNTTTGRLLTFNNGVQTNELNLGEKLPISIVTDKNGAIWVYTITRVSEYGILNKIVNNTIVDTINIGGGGYPTTQLVVSSNNDIYLTFANNQSYYVNTTTKAIHNFYTASGSDQLYGLTISKDGYIYILMNTGILIYNKNNAFITKMTTTSAIGMMRGDSTGYQWDIMFNPQKHLFQSGSTIKTWNGTDFSNVGSIPVTDSMFETNGFSDLAGLTKDKLSTLYSPKLLLKKSDSTNISTKFTGTPLPKLVLAGSDITLSSNISNIDKFTLTANVLNTANLRIITSVDSGTTWEAYNVSTSNWETVDKNDLNAVKTKGNTPAQLNALDANVWNSKVLNGNKKVRFGYYLEVNSTTDTIETDLLTMQADANGKWKACANNTEYTYSYSADNILSIKLLASGDYRMTVI